MHQRHSDWVAGGSVPDARGVVIRRGRKQPTVLAEGDVHNCSLVVQGWRQRLAGGRVPNSRSLVESGRSDAISVWTEGGMSQAAWVLQEYGGTSSQIPDTSRRRRLRAARNLVGEDQQPVSSDTKLHTIDGQVVRQRFQRLLPL